MSHTKGPWIAELLLFNRTDEMRFLLSTPDDEFGHMQLRNSNIYDALANARVIAAAPDLLAACENNLKWMHFFLDYADKHEVDFRGYLDGVKLSIADAEAAVKKARGE